MTETAREYVSRVHRNLARGFGEMVPKWLAKARAAETPYRQRCNINAAAGCAQKAYRNAVLAEELGRSQKGEV
jgi:hypothetical protein